MTRPSYSLPFALLFACAALQGCSSVKKTLGIDRDPPEEYAVSPSLRPLDMPPDFTYLPSPTPGVERPQDKFARQNQKEKIIGTTGDQRFLSPGQKALLEMSQVTPNQEDVRHKIDTEARMEKKEDKTIIQRLGIKKTKPAGDAVNPYQEAEELEKRGIPTSPAAVRTESMPPLREKNPQGE